jgi:hypothetical protein
VSDDFADIEAAVRRLPQPSLADILRARREAEQAPPPPPTTIPLPESPYPFRHPLGGTMRFHCPLGCGWWHDENPGAELPGPILLPVDFTDGDLSAAFTSMAEVRGNNVRLRVEQAIADHFTQAHPGR